MRRSKRQKAIQLRNRNRKKQRLSRLALQTSTAAIVSLASGAMAEKIGPAIPPDPHWVPVLNDSDGDFLSDAEEQAIGSAMDDRDQNKNGIPDGVDLALRCAGAIDSLPRHVEGPVPAGVYVVEYPLRGMETCEVCGELVNMGYLEVKNPLKDLVVQLPFISYHSMHHGSFSYNGTLHDGRVDVPNLLAALNMTYTNSHQQPVPNDSDGDLLSDAEEYGLGYQPFNADQNQNEIPDGEDLALAVHTKVRNLIDQGGSDTIKIIRHEVDGMEQCDICGAEIHMGGTEFENQTLELRYPEGDGFLPDLALHYMEHGSLDYFGTVHNGRTEIIRLMRVLEMVLPHIEDKHELPVKDSDTDFDSLTDAEEIKIKTNLYNPDQDANLVPDGVDLAKQCKRAIDKLHAYDKTQSDPAGPYKIEHPLRGVEQCHVCGELVNMGWIEIFNPTQGSSIEVTYLQCHYMEHGSFEFSGDVHGRERVNVPRLFNILELPWACGDIGRLCPPVDAD